MRRFADLSGPWTGFSVQDGLRIHEAISLVIHGGSIQGSGQDMDGDFELVGQYLESSDEVYLTRRYTRTTDPSQGDVGIPFDYSGRWDGAMVSGRWCPRSHPFYGGPFEMWPNREEDREELAIHLEEAELTQTQG